MNAFFDENSPGKFLVLDVGDEGDFFFTASDEHAQRIVTVSLSSSQAVRVRDLLAKLLKDLSAGDLEPR